MKKLLLSYLLVLLLIASSCSGFRYPYVQRNSNRPVKSLRKQNAYPHVQKKGAIKPPKALRSQSTYPYVKISRSTKKDNFPNTKKLKFKSNSKNRGKSRRPRKTLRKCNKIFDEY